MSASIYIESSVISYLTARPSRDVVAASGQAITAEWWQSNLPRYETYVSVLVIEEVSAGDPGAAARRLNAVATLPVVAVQSEALPLADALLKSKAAPARCDCDAFPGGDIKRWRRAKKVALIESSNAEWYETEPW